MQTATEEDMQAHFAEFLELVSAGAEFVVTSGGKPVARILPPEFPKGVPVLGRGKGKLISYVDDDEHLEDFKDYMP